MLGEPALEGFPDRIEMGCAIDVGLADMREVAAEVGQQRPPDRPYETLEVVQFAGVRGGDQGGADLDDFHFLQGPAAFRGGGLQIDYQPVRHRSYPYQGPR